MTRCPCGCTSPVKPGAKFATKPCWHRLVTPAQRAAWSRGPRARRVPVVEMVCLRPGCGARFVRNIPTRRYCSRGCATKHRATAPEFAEFEKARLAKASRARLERGWADAAARVAGLDSVSAYRRGYRTGYKRAADFYRHQLRIAIARHQREISELATRLQRSA